MGENGAASGGRPVVEDRSEMIDAGALQDGCSQQLEKEKGHRRRFLELGLFSVYGIHTLRKKGDAPLIGCGSKKL